MQEIPRTKRVEVAQCFLLGHSYKQIEQKTKVSHGTIATVVKELESGRLDIPGIAFDHVNDLRQLSLDLKKTDLSTSQALLGLQFFERCRSLGMDLEQLDRWAGIVSRFTSADFPKEDFLRAALRLQQLEKSQGKPFEILADEYESTKEHLDRINAEVDSSATKKEHLLKEIKPLSVQKDMLTREKGDLENQAKALTRRADELKPRVAEMEKEKSGLAKEIGELERTKTRLSSEVGGKEESLARLNDIGFLDEDLLRLRTIIERIASDHNADAKEVKERIFLALGSCQDLVQLDRSREVEMEEVRELAEEKHLLEGEIVELQKRKAILLGEIGRAAASVTAEIKEVGEKAVSELRVQVEYLRGSVGGLITDTMRAAGVITSMKAEVEKGEESEKGLRDLIAEVEAELGRN
jgi:chromosome segregation ATPase